MLSSFYSSSFSFFSSFWNALLPFSTNKFHHSINFINPSFWNYFVGWTNASLASYSSFSHVFLPFLSNYQTIPILVVFIWICLLHVFGIFSNSLQAIIIWVIESLLCCLSYFWVIIQSHALNFSAFLSLWFEFIFFFSFR